MITSRSLVSFIRQIRGFSADLKTEERYSVITPTRRLPSLEPTTMVSSSAFRRVGLSYKFIKPLLISKHTRHSPTPNADVNSTLSTGPLKTPSPTSRLPLPSSVPLSDLYLSVKGGSQRLNLYLNSVVMMPVRRRSKDSTISGTTLTLGGALSGMTRRSTRGATREFIYHLFCVSISLKCSFFPFRG